MLILCLGTKGYPRPFLETLWILMSMNFSKFPTGGSPRRYEQFDSEPCSGGARVWYKTTDTTRSVCIKKFALPIGKFVKHYVNHHKTTLLTMMKSHMNFKALILLLVNRTFVYEAFCTKWM